MTRLILEHVFKTTAVTVSEFADFALCSKLGHFLASVQEIKLEFMIVPS